MSFSDEASQWEENLNRPPYGKIHLLTAGVTLYTVAAIPPLPPSVSRVVGGEGYIRFKIVNLQIRRIPVKLRALLSDKVQWVEGFPGAKRISTWVPAALDGRAGEKNEMERFLALKEGQAYCETKEHEQGDEASSALSEFYVKIDTQGQSMKKDYLGAIAEAAKALPGGELILGPLIKLRDDEQRQADQVELNAKLDALLSRQQPVTASAFLPFLPESRENQMTAEVAAKFITAQSKPNTHVNRWSDLTISAWPFPFKEQLLREELNALFGQVDQKEAFLDCLRVYMVEMESNQVAGSPQKINHFLGAIKGQGRETLKNVFNCLFAKRPASQILEACVAVLSERPLSNDN